MEAFLIYLGKVALAMCAFSLTFLALFRKQKHFTFNRVYLVVSMAASYLIPLITFSVLKQIEATPQLPGLTLNNISSTTYPVIEEINKTTYYWFHYLFATLLLGVAVFFINFLAGNIKALLIVRKSYRKKELGANVCITKEDVHPFSFFNKIIISEKSLKHPSLNIILEHEKIHANKKHTLDILFAELLFLLEWFNPFAWLLKDAVKNNLEYLTDDYITQHNDRETYQLAMVSLVGKKGVAPFLTALNGSQLKNRIIMMKKKKENKFIRMKQLALIPVLTLLILGLSNKKVHTEIIAKHKQETYANTEIPLSISNEAKDEGWDVIALDKSNILKKEVTADSIDFPEGKGVDGAIEITTTNVGQKHANYEHITDKQVDKKQKKKVYCKVDEAPIFPGGAKALIDYISNNIRYPEIARENGIEGKVFINFIINKKGKVKEPKIKRGIAPSLDKEAVRVVKTLPKWIPGKMGGKPVNTYYTVPVSFKIAPTDRVIKVVQITDTSETAKTAPLIIIDGNITHQTFYDLEITPDDIEEISVLKGESAIVLYDEKAKDGVILITTKKTASLLKEFLILIEYSDNALRIENLKGCAFQHLSFNLPDEKVQAINQYGMTTANEKNREKDKNLADFLFTISRSGDSFILNGIDGTSWKNLSYKKQGEDIARFYVGQNGLEFYKPEELKLP